jgi:hypothetical protein
MVSPSRRWVSHMCSVRGMIPRFTSAAVLTQKGGLNPESTDFENHFPRTDFIILRPNTYAPLVPTGVTSIESIFTIVPPLSAEDRTGINDTDVHQVDLGRVHDFG